MLKVQFDGDIYLLTLPPLEAVLGLARMERRGNYNIPFLGDPEEQVYLIGSQPFHNTLLHSSMDIEHQLDFLDGKKKLPMASIATMEKRHWRLHNLVADFMPFGFRPCLIPLDAGGRANKKVILGTEDGDLLTGGTFWHDCGLPDWRAPVLSEPSDNQISDPFFSLSSIEFRDSILDSNANLQWVFFDGFLICTRILFEANIQQMEGQGLLDSEPELPPGEGFEQ